MSGVVQSSSVYNDLGRGSENHDPLELVYNLAFDAYLKDDHQTAFLKWTEAAKQKHARSQFNLALMHERGQVPNGQSSNAMALDLYKRSANGHYLPAYQYWAKLVEKDRPELAQRIRNILREKTQKTLQPIAESVQVADAEKVLMESQVGKSQGESLGSLQREKWISQQRDNNWTIQIVAYRDEVQLLEFADQSNLSGQGAYFMETAAGKTGYKLILGSFTSKQAADQARTNLPASVRGEGPWLRQFKDVKTSINSLN